MTQKAAAELLKIPQSTFSDMKRRIITRERTNHKIKGLSVLGVDEISYAKGHKYATVVYDLVKAKVVWVGEGKGKDTLNKFFKEHLSEYQRDKIEYACCDMSRAYISSIKTWLTKAKLIIDRFHMVKALNEAMDEVRKEEWRKVQEVDKNALKGLRWMLFRHSSTRSKEETKTIIDKVRVSNNRIYRAWLLKDEFESFWEYSYVGSAEKFLKRWITRALRSRLEPIRKFAKTLREHKDYILPYIDTGITNAKGEGINRLLQLLKNRSSGFMNLEAYKDMIYLLVGDVDIPARIPERFRTI
jgi:transposase